MKTEEQENSEKKVTNYLTMFNFLLVFLVGYYYGMHYGAILAAISSLAISFTRPVSPLPLYKQIWSLSSAYVMIIAVGLINPSVIPVGIAGVIFTTLGLHLRQSKTKKPQKYMIMAGALAIGIYGSLVEYPRFVQTIMNKPVHITLTNFEVTDLNNSPVYLNDLKNKVVLIDFWASWCKPCRDEFKDLEKVVAHFENNENVVFLITNAAGSGDNLQKVQHFAAQNNYKLPFFIDQHGSATAQFNVTAFPTLALIDQQGVVKLVHEGYSNAEELDQFLIKKINQLLKK